MTTAHAKQTFWRSIRPRRSHGLLLGGVWLRCRVWAHSAELDAALAIGVDPLQSDELSLRAGQLRSPKRRMRTYRSLLAALDAADRSNPRALPASVRRRRVRECRALITDLAERVRDGNGPSVRGLAITSQLLREGGGPLHFERSSKSLRETLITALVALDDPPARTRPQAPGGADD
jgi:hypothetical protein